MAESVAEGRPVLGYCMAVGYFGTDTARVTENALRAALARAARQG